VTYGVKASSIGIGVGSLSEPALFFTGDRGTGMYTGGGADLRFASNGTLGLRQTASAILPNLPIRMTDGTAASCSYAISGENGTGLYQPGDEQLAISINASPRVIVAASSTTVKGTLGVEAGNFTVSGAITGPQTFTSSVTITGVTDGTTVTAGNVGQVISTSPVAARTMLETAQYGAISTTTLSAGAWLVWGKCEIATSGTSAMTQIGCGISTLSTTSDSNAEVIDLAFVPGVSLGSALNFGPRVINISASTAYYLVARARYTVDGGATWTTNSWLRAIRIR